MTSLAFAAPEPAWGRRWPAIDHVFLAVALVWGIVQVFVVPPLQVPDEGDHFFRAWALSDGQLFAASDRTVQLPSDLKPLAELYLPIVLGDTRGLPLSIEEIDGFQGYGPLFNGPAGGEPFRASSRVATYGPLGYLPQAAGIAMGRLAGSSLLDQFYLARLANLVVAVALVVMAIRLAPFGKPLFLLFGLMPMTMYEFASVAIDAMTIAGALLFIAVMLNMTTRTRIGPGLIAAVLLAATVLLTVKPGYWALVLLILLLKPDQLGGRRALMTFAAAGCLLVTAVFGLLLVTTSSTVRLETGGGARDQLLFILTDPAAFLGIILENIADRGLSWIFQSIGVLGWLNVALPPALYLFVFIAAVGILVRFREPVPLERAQRLLLAVVAVALFGSMAVALYAFLEPIGSTRIFVQGRYLAPMWLLLCLAVYGLWFAPRRVGTVFVTGVAVVLAVESLQTLARTYGG